jgi:hypothetical protein
VVGAFVLVGTRFVAVVVLLLLDFVVDFFVVVLDGVVDSGGSTMNVVLIKSSSDNVDGSTFMMSAIKKIVTLLT